MALLKRKGKVTEVTGAPTTVTTTTPEAQNAQAPLPQSDLVTTTTTTVTPATVVVPVTTVVPVAPVVPVAAVTSAPTKKKSLSPLFLGVGALGLAGLSLVAWHFMGASTVPDADTSAPVALRPRPLVPKAPGKVASAVTTPGTIKNSGGPEATVPGPAPLGGTRTTTRTRTTSTRVAAAGATTAGGASPGTRTTRTTSTRTTRVGVAGAVPTRQAGSVARVQRAASVQPGRLGQRPPGLPEGVPAFAPSRPGQLPRIIPARGAPTPIQPPEGLAGTPGKRGIRNEIRIAAPRVAASPEQLKALWKEGAAFKKRGDNEAARRAWRRILQLDPGHEGIQDAIDKLR